MIMKSIAVHNYIMSPGNERDHSLLLLWMGRTFHSLSNFCDWWETVDQASWRGNVSSSRRHIASSQGGLSTLFRIGYRLDHRCDWGWGTVDPRCSTIYILKYLEFVFNNNGAQWDKPPQGNSHHLSPELPSNEALSQHLLYHLGGNYIINSPGQYFIKSGRLYALVPPPDRPALLEASSIKASSVHLVWNGPPARITDVKGYQLFRDGALVASLGMVYSFIMIYLCSKRNQYD